MFGELMTQKNNDGKQQIVLATNLLEFPTLNKCLKGFFTSICNITNVLQNWRIYFNRGFDSKVLLKCALKP